NTSSTIDKVPRSRGKIKTRRDYKLLFFQFEFQYQQFYQKGLRSKPLANIEIKVLNLAFSNDITQFAYLVSETN
ncbi:25991_t:CDS:2, partial [Gigaspora rosea]